MDHSFRARAALRKRCARAGSRRLAPRAAAERAGRGVPDARAGLDLRSAVDVLQANKHIVKRIFTGTSLGTLVVDEYFSAKLYSDGQPDFFIVGQPAWRSTIKYPGDKWSTSVGVQVDNGRLLIATADRRLDGTEGESFVSLLESLVLSTY